VQKYKKIRALFKRVKKRKKLKVERKRKLGIMMMNLMTVERRKLICFSLKQDLLEIYLCFMT
jgi:hypothetical protein